MRLLQSQKNEVFDLIGEAGLSPGMFTFQDPVQNDPSSYLFLTNSEYYFEFSSTEGGAHYARFSPGLDTVDDSKYSNTWDNQRILVRNWLKYLKRELTSGDKWKSFEEELRNVHFEDIKYEEKKFTYEEYQMLSDKMDELKSNLSSLNLMEDQLVAINTKLDHLLKLAQNMSKTDWKELFIGSIMSLFLQLSVDKETGISIWGHIRTLFTQLLPAAK